MASAIGRKGRGMLWAVLVHLAGFIVDLVVVARHADRAKCLEIALLRHQVRLLQRQASRPVRLSLWEKLTLAVLAMKLSRLTTARQEWLARAIFLVQPATVLKWHRELVRRKWTFTTAIRVGDRRSPPRSRRCSCV
jgi:putative transposase